MSNASVAKSASGLVVIPWFRRILAGPTAQHATRTAGSLAIGCHMRSGAFERELTIWFDQFRRWLDQRERFTCIALLLAVAPSPPAALLAIILAGLQLYLCHNGRIPASERPYLVASLALGTLNFGATVILYHVLFVHTRSLWSFWNPLGWPFWLFRQRIFPDVQPIPINAVMGGGLT